MAEDARKKHLLIITSDNSLQGDMGDNLVLQGFDVTARSALDKAVQVLESEHIDIILLDLEGLPNQEMSLVHYVKARQHDTEVVVLATVKELEEARNAVRAGAAFYLIKPVAFRDLKQVLDKLSRRMDADRERHQLEQRALSDLMADSPAMHKVLNLALKIAPTVSTVLIGGESGTGKEFFARIIYRMSTRHDGPFVPVNCGAIPDTLFESELFGHRKGSFTGADRDRTGLVEEAHMGTLFLDEVGELSPAAQVKLLRFLQERSFKHVGDNETRTVDVRVIAATNKDLMQLVRDGAFREDLFYRLHVFYLHLPPLRERRETLPALIKLFVHRYNQLLGRHVSSIAKDAEVSLANYDYPGNVRELENIIEHAVVLAEGDEIRKADLPETMHRSQLLLSAPDACAEAAADGEFPTLEDMERRHIERALERFENNYTEVARRLGISRSTLWRKLKSYGIESESEKESA